MTAISCERAVSGPVLPFCQLMNCLCSYSATQGMRVYIYDTRRAPRVGDKSVIDDSSANPPAQPNRRARSLYGTPWDHRTSLKTTRVVKANSALCQWTITDANLSRDNSMLVYS